MSTRVSAPHTVTVQLRPAAFTSSTLAYVAYTALERQRQLQDMVTMHAASVVLPGGGAVLLLGDKGSGKTNTLLALTARGCVPAGDDLVLVRHAGSFLEVLPGKPIASARHTSQRASPFYEIKHETALDEAGFLSEVAPIVRVVRLNVHAAATGSARRQIYQLPVNERLRLHENLTRHISGIPTPLDLHETGSSGPVWPIDTDDCARLRADMTNLFARAPFYYLQARDADEASELILETT